MKVEKFEDLEIWQLSGELCKEVYQPNNAAPFLKGFKELLNDSEIISRKTSNLMHHLRKSDMKGPKYRQP